MTAGPPCAPPHSHEAGLRHRGRAFVQSLSKRPPSRVQFRPRNDRKRAIMWVMAVVIGHLRGRTCGVSDHLPIVFSRSSTSLVTIFSRTAMSPLALSSKYPTTLFSTYFPTWSTSTFTSSPGCLPAVTTFSCV